MSVSDDIARQILEQAKHTDEVRQHLDKVAEQVRDYWRAIGPPRDISHNYEAGVVVYKNRYTVNGMPARRIGATDFKSHWIEFGTQAKEPDEHGKGGHSATPAFAPRAKTAAHFNGNEEHVKMILDNADLSFDERVKALSEFDAVIVPVPPA